MPVLLCNQVEVYVFRRRLSRVEFLVLRRSARGKLPGVWQPVTGTRWSRERPLAAAIREVREETGLSPRRWWVLETLTMYFDPARNAVVALPLFAAEVRAEDRVTLSSEHSDHRFLPAAAAGRRFLWQAQRRGLEAVRREVLKGGPLASALELPVAAAKPVTSSHRRRP